MGYSFALSFEDYLGPEVYQQNFVILYGFFYFCLEVVNDIGNIFENGSLTIFFGIDLRRSLVHLTFIILIFGGTLLGIDLNRIAPAPNLIRSFPSLHLSHGIGQLPLQFLQPLIIPQHLIPCFDNILPRAHHNLISYIILDLACTIGIIGHHIEECYREHNQRDH